MKFSLRIALTISLLLISCAKKPVTRVTVKVADTFSGYVHLDACVSIAKEPAEPDESGYGHTAACPVGNVEILVTNGTKSFVIPPESVKVHRNPSGQPMYITFQIPRER
jgi:hypothetical protein